MLTRVEQRHFGIAEAAPTKTITREPAPVDNQSGGLEARRMRREQPDQAGLQSQLWGETFPQPLSPLDAAGKPEHAMTMRTTKQIVTFARPFRLGEAGAELPAGQYSIETDEERVDELSFPFYRRTATLMQLIADPLRPGITETVTIDPLELEAALEGDRAQVPEAEPEATNPPSISGRPREAGRPTEEPVANTEMKPVAL